MSDEIILASADLDNSKFEAKARQTMQTAARLESALRTGRFNANVTGSYNNNTTGSYPASGAAYPGSGGRTMGFYGGPVYAGQQGNFRTLSMGGSGPHVGAGHPNWLFPKQQPWPVPYGAKGINQVVNRFHPPSAGPSLEWGKLSDLNPLFRLMGFLVKFGTVLDATVVAASRVAAKFSRIERSLEVSQGDRQAGEKEMWRIWLLAKRPGIEFEEGVNSFNKLRQAGLTTRQSERLIAATGKIINITGGGTEEFQHAMWALTETANKPYAQGQELYRQLSNANIPIARIMKESFGVSTAEDLKSKGINSMQVLEAFVKYIEKMPDAVESEQNAWDNFMTSVHMSIVRTGKGINKTFLDILKEGEKTMDKGIMGGTFDAIGEAIANSLAGMMGDTSTDELLVNIGAGVMTAAQLLERLVANAKELVGLIMFGPVGWIVNTARGGTDMGTIPDMYAQNQEILRNTLKVGEQRDAKLKERENMNLQAEELEKSTTKLDEIATYTKKTADILERHIDRAQRVLGGGSIASMGITNGERARINNGPGRGRAESAIMWGITQMFLEMEAEIRMGRARG